MYKLYSRGNGYEPCSAWQAASMRYQDEDFEAALRDLLRWKDDGQRVALAWVPDGEQAEAPMHE